MTPPTFLIPLDHQFLAVNAHLVEQSSQLAQAYQTKTTIIEDEVLASIGASLWQAVDCEAEFTRHEQTSGQAALNIVIESHEPTVLSLAWETLYHPEFGFLGRSEHFTLSRRLPMQPTPNLPAPECTPLRILLFAAMPMDLGEHGRLQIEEEKANILQAVTPLEELGQVTLISPDDGRFESFKQALQAHQPHLIYLSGHGSLQHNAVDNTYQGQFLFEDNHANSLGVSEDDLVACFNNTHVQAIVLSACESGKFDARELNNGLSTRLAQKGIPHVIGMRESILDNAGLEFAATFLQQIANKHSVATALQDARRAIKTHISGYVTREQQNNPIRTAITKQQWCLPSLISHEISQPLVDWSFTPEPKEYVISFNDSMDNISLPEQFLGRKRELYTLSQPLLDGTQKQLLLTAAGGMGKTALAGKLCQQLKQAGFEVFAYSAREGNRWSDFVTDLEFALEASHATRYDERKARMSETQQAQTLLKYLLAQHQGKVVLFLDNLESIQDLQSRELTDDELKFWISVAQTLTTQGLRIILTSRWCLPGWEGDVHYDLEKPAYSDFIAFARQRGLLNTLTEHRKSHEVYDVLGGNFRAFEFFVNASKTMDIAEANDFLSALNQAKDESQTDMALEKVLSQLSEREKSLLARILAYPTAVPIKGISVVALKVIPPLSEKGEHVDAIRALANVSLVERIYNNEFMETEYQVAPIVKDYLIQRGQKTPIETLKAAALYLYNDLLKQRPSLDLALLIHAALTNADEAEVAQQLLLNVITGALNRAGLYHSLLNEYLIPSLTLTLPDKILAETLGQIGKQYHHVGSYDKALTYFKQSLAIRQEIGDKSGEGTTLNNISQIYDARGDYETALTYLKQSLAIVQEIGDKSGEGTTLNNIATTAHARGDYETALTYFKQSLAIRQEIGDKSGEGTTLNNIATTAHARGDYETALTYLKQSLAIVQEVGDKSGEGTTLNNISQIFNARGDHETALTYLKQSLAIVQEIGDKSGEGTTLNNISQIFKARGDYDSALTYLKQSLAIRQEIGDKSGEGTTLNNISQIFKARGDYETALTYLKQSLAIQQEIGDKSGLCATLFNIGHIHYQNGEKHQAVEDWGSVYVIAKEIGNDQALQALEGLAPQIGLEDGIAGWETLVKHR
ncbi:MAG: tetratricopeptide repeat protein [Aliiglaciecola sp.]|uniref:tetratricopeptide repeat protein n=1 Tax=Aliiglaciecola sp. TaxID=1872441 RepID=UPI00329A4F33